MLRSALLDAVPGLVHGLTTRDEGSIGPASDPAAAARREAIVERLLGRRLPPVAPHQVHGARVATVASRDDRPGEADAVATSARGVPLMVQGADCPLVLLVAPPAPALALVHSGWRGTVARIAAHAVRALAALGASPADVRAAVFPGIGSCCFEVGPEVIRAVHDAFGGAARAWHVPTARAGHARLDLHAAIVRTLVDAGVASEAVDRVPGCTACGGRLWSHRASGGAPQRHGLFAALA